MVYLVLTRPGYEKLISQLQRIPSPLWVNKDVLAPAELEAVRAQVELSDFVYYITPNNIQEVEKAAYTVKEHHPNETVWVEFVSAP
jgi:hypothetical protein